MAFVRVVVGLLCLVLAAGCAHVAPQPQAVAPRDVAAAPETQKAAVPSKPSVEPSAAPAPDRMIYYRGRQGAIRLPDAADARLSKKTLSLNFVDAPASDVARVVVNDALGETLAVADGVQGRITLTSPSPVSARKALDALEAALAESGLALVRKPTGFLLTTLAAAGSATTAPQLDRAADAGFGATIVAVSHAAPSQLVQLAEPFVSKRVTMTANDGGQFITLRGLRPDMEEARQALEAFDTPYLTDRTYGLFEVRFANVETVRAEVETVMNASGAAPRSVDVIALPRLNLLFISARTEDRFQEAKAWVDRLDRPSTGEERRLRYYVAQNTPATTLASQVSAAFGAAGQNGASIARRAAEHEAAAAPAATSPQLGQTQARPQRTESSGGAVQASVTASGVSIVPDELNNALIIRATDNEYRDLLELLEKMDVLAPQVLIEATIAEVSLNNDLNYGVRWFLQKKNVTLNQSDSSGGGVGPIFPGFNFTYLRSDVRVALNMLASVTDVNVLSAPSIMVQNNQSANLQVGDQVPIVTRTAQATSDAGAPVVSTVELRDTGVILDVKPRINASDMVVLEVTQEVSDVVATTTSGIDSPTIRQRRFTSTVAVADNGTVALGGLIRQTRTDGKSGIPILQSIPLVGAFFRTRDLEARRTELIIFLTPRIVRDSSAASSALDDLRKSMRSLERRLPEHLK